MRFRIIHFHLKRWLLPAAVIGALTHVHLAWAAEPLPPVPVDELQGNAPSPSWDTGMLFAACGVKAERFWEKTRFCGGGLVDVIWGRADETEAGGGAYFQVATSGFSDVRPSLGLSGIVSLVEWFTISGRTGGLVRVGQGGPRPGVEGYLEFGHRSVSYESAYSLSHALLTGIQWVSKGTQDPRAETTLWVGLRIDGIWLTAPKMLF